MRRTLKAINPFLTENQIDDVVRKISIFDHFSLIENNRRVLELLRSPWGQGLQ
jgi:hypothetical protein